MFGRERMYYFYPTCCFLLCTESQAVITGGGEAGLVSLLPWFSKTWSKHECTVPSPPPLPFFSFSLFPLQQFLKSQREGLDRAESQTPLCGRPVDHLSVSAVGIPRAALVHWQSRCSGHVCSMKGRMAENTWKLLKNLNPWCRGLGRGRLESWGWATFPLPLQTFPLISAAVHVEMEAERKSH